MYVCMPHVCMHVCMSHVYMYVWESCLYYVCDIEADVKLDATSEEFRWVSASEIHEYDPYVQELMHEVYAR